MIEVLETFQPEEYLSALPTRSRDYALALLSAGVSALEIAERLASEPGQGLATKGGVSWPSDLLTRVGKELRLLICTEDGKYESIRSKLKSESKVAASVIVYVISNAVASQAGMAPALCVPLVALLLAAAVKVGVIAWCGSSIQPIALASSESSDSKADGN